MEDAKRDITPEREPAPASHARVREALSDIGRIAGRHLAHQNRQTRDDIVKRWLWVYANPVTKAAREMAHDALKRFGALPEQQEREPGMEG